MRFFKKVWIYLKPFCNWRFLISYSIPFMIFNGWSWIGVYLIPFVGMNWFTSISLAWQGILWMPWTCEKLLSIPIAIWIHTRIFKHDKITHYRLLRMYVQAKRDFEKIKSKFKRKKNDA